MQISSISALLCGSIFTFGVFCFFYLYFWYIQKSIQLPQIKCLILGGILVLLRFLLPVEFLFSQNILSEHVLPVLHYNLEKKIGEFTVFCFLISISFIGSIILLFRCAICSLEYRKIFKYTKLVNDETIVNVMKEIEEKKGTQIHVQILESKFIKEPILTGIFHPKILLPYNIERAELKYIFAHEIEHYLNKDLFLKFFIEIVSILLWWNPTVYVLKKKIAQFLEVRADLEAVKVFSEEEKLLYLECLLNVARKKRKNSVWELGFSEGTSSLIRKRLYLILGKKYKKKKRDIYYFLIPVFIFLLSFVIVVEPYYITEEQEQGSFSLEDNIEIRMKNGIYEIIVNDELIGELEKLPDDFLNIPIEK